MSPIPPVVGRLIPSLGRDNDFEALATRDAIVRALRDVGLDLHDLASAISASSKEQSSSAIPSAFGDLARACRDLDGGRLAPRERAFVSQMVAMGFVARPSQRQAAWLAAIFARLQRREAA